MAKRLKTFNVMAKLNLECVIGINAESIEDALVKAKRLTEEDFVDVLGDLNSGSLIVFGVFENDGAK